MPDPLENVVVTIHYKCSLGLQKILPFHQDLEMEISVLGDIIIYTSVAR